MPSPHLDSKTVYTDEGCKSIHAQFLAALQKCDVDLFSLHGNILEGERSFATKKDESSFLLELSPYLEDFIASLFNIQKEVRKLQQDQTRLAPLFEVKRQFVQRRALKAGAEEIKNFIPSAIIQKRYTTPSIIEGELVFAMDVLDWLENEQTYSQKIEDALQYARWACLTPEGRAAHRHGVLFKVPQKRDYHNLVSKDHLDDTPSYNGFHLRDNGISHAQTQDQIHYCILCHNQGKDTCSTGYPDKQNPGTFAQNPLGNILSGCPLEQKISEAHTLRRQGLTIAALAMMMVDNPLLALTGHRICNDCVKSCIFQNQDTVDIPGIETAILKDVLALPYGVEIYSLLSRWNPLNLKRPLPLPHTGKRILVVGAGPAGINLSHHLLQEGHTVVMIDGARMTPWKIKDAFIKEWASIYEDLETRVIQGFGGVMEYGITARWDKNHLTLARLILERNPQFLLKGGVRFGGTLTEAQAFDDFGFDHIALCMGTGSPTVPPLTNMLSSDGFTPGVRLASDFLMALQLTGARQKDNIAKLPLRLPIVVMGAGLTAIDTATEALHYYPRYVEKVVEQLENMSPDARKSYDASLSPTEIKSLREIQHHHSLFKEAPQKGENLFSIIKRLGGVTLLYRRTMADSPAYKLNHEELSHLLRLGIEFRENLTPTRIRRDVFGHLKGIYAEDTCTEKSNPNDTYIPARSLLIAAGTKPNTNILKDDPHFAPLDARGVFFKPLSHERFLLKKRADGKAVSFLGDMHPDFHGSVVKAMASAKEAYPTISTLVNNITHRNTLTSQEFLKNINHALTPHIKSITPLTDHVSEVVIRAPAAASNLKPGEFFRLQDFHSPGTDPFVISGAWSDKKEGLVGTFVFHRRENEHARQPSLIHRLKVNDNIVLMGPTGKPAFIPQGKHALIMAEGHGHAAMPAIAQAMMDNGCTVTYMAFYKNESEVFNRAMIEESSHRVVWVSEKGHITVKRSVDLSFEETSSKQLLSLLQNTSDTPYDHIHIMGSPRFSKMMGYFMEQSRTWCELLIEGSSPHTEKSPILSSGCTLAISPTAPMQCMLKGVCGRCTTC